MSPIRIIPFVVILIALPAACAQTPDEPIAAADTDDQPVAQQAGFVAEITGNDVYVRSGPSTNYYPVAKLSAGARVQVIGQEETWLAIVPPQGCFSLISDMYVDTADDRHGVVNGDNVRVRAGSMLNDKMYAIQRKLSKGAEVEIVGRSDDGYYRIKPPAGAKLWISQQFVAQVPEELLTLEAESQAEPTLIQPELAVPPADPDTEPAAELTGSVTPMSPEQIGELRGSLEELDAALKAELNKPLLRRDLDRFNTAFAALADQSTDEFTRLYAGVRMDQIADMMDMIQAVRDVQQLREQVHATRTDALAARAGIHRRPLPIEGGFHVEGELRPSVAYADPAGPQRYRLVAPGRSPVRTIAYVEIPPGSMINADEFLGRLVGIRASETWIETGNVDPISIYVAAEIVPLDAGQE